MPKELIFFVCLIISQSLAPYLWDTLDMEFYLLLVKQIQVHIWFPLKFVFYRVELAKRIPWLAINEQEPKDNVSTTTEATATTPAE